MVNKLTVLDVVTLILVIVGGLNWGLVAINPAYDLVAMLPGAVATVVYVLVALSAVYLALVASKLARK